ncbi:beta-lactamase-like protein [Dipodascopsis tothii]|uniref:beta-lactamase-like protein n=1 Tax=Dipodascopsis tothii TaxID=44089 RepID=UPI0034CDE69D
MAAKRAPATFGEPLVDDSDYLSFVALGGGNEVGRSCHIISYKGKTVMLDTGVHPALSGLRSLPYYDDYDLSTVDVLLISHFHLDHAASLPYVMEHTTFKGRVFMTHPTKAIYRWLLSDFVRVSSIAEMDAAQLYTDADLNSSFDRIEAIDYHSTIEVDGIKFTAFHAGHVLGAAMYFIEIGGIKLLFTGDYSREEDRHLNVAEVPPDRPDILITESTYGTSSHQSRQEKETRLLALIQKTVLNGGRCLLPVFSLGTAQEILLILDEYWQAHPELDAIPVYYASSLAKKCLAVYQTYINMMNDRIRKKFRDDRTNPFMFKHIKSIRNLERFDDLGPSVMVATPGMLQNGVSRELLERWAPDSKNLLILTGYSVEGTLAKQLINEPTEFPSISGGGVKLPRRLGIEELSFAAHVDYKQNSEFIDKVNAPNIILVHGEQTNMGRLKSALQSKYKELKDTENEIKVFSPRNSEELRLPFRGIKTAKIMGRLAEQPADAQILSGVIVQKNFQMSIMAADDLREFSGLTTTSIRQRQTVPVSAPVALVQYHLEQMFGKIKELDVVGDDARPGFLVLGEVSVWCHDDSAVIEWTGNMFNDTIADSVLCVLLAVDSSPVSVKMAQQHDHVHEQLSRDEIFERVLMFLESQFGDAVQPGEDGVKIVIDGHVADVKLGSIEVECSYEPLRSRVRHVLERAVDTVLPLDN